MQGHPRVSVLAWTSRCGRACDLAGALGIDVEARCFFPARLSSRYLAPLRYMASVILTLRYLRKRRPQAVIVTNPPVFAALTVAVWGKMTGRKFILDSHPTSFGAKGHRVCQVLLPLHRALARRAAATLVTTVDWVEVVNSWGGRGLVVHEPPPPSSSLPSSELGRVQSTTQRPQVLFVGIFAGDEPVAEVIDAAAYLPQIDFAITGDLARCPAGLRAAAGRNVVFTGYLQTVSYAQAIARSDVIIALTTEPTSVMRAAYEAVYAQRPLVISDTPVLRGLFASAVFVDNNAGSIAEGIRFAVDHQDQLLDSAPVARSQQHDRWLLQLAQLSDHLLRHHGFYTWSL